MTLKQFVSELQICIREKQIPSEAVVFSSRGIPIKGIECDLKTKCIFLLEEKAQQ